VLCVVV